MGVRSGRWTASDGSVLFASAVLLLSLCLVMVDGAGTSVGATSVPNSTPSTSAQTQTTQLPVPTTTTTSPPTTTSSTSPPTTTTTLPPTTTTTTLPPAPAPPPAPSTALPAKGQATADGCAAALAYLSAYSAPGFTFECPGYALGHEAMTCVNEAGVCANEDLIAIADPCAAAYMNEASNSWVMTGASDAPIDPYGACP
jgi:cytoskeletal protein RodZ